MTFISWAGGKSKVLNKIIPNILSFIREEEINIYIEPFLGSGAILIELLESDLKFDKYIVSDLNSNLINCFKQIRDNCYNLIERLKRLEEDYNSLTNDNQRDYYYTMRDYYNDIINNEDEEIQLEKAGLFIFLNKTCFRGLYRITKSGKFNIAFGDYRKVSLVNEKRILELKGLFEKSEVILNVYSYEKVLDILDEYSEYNCIVYLDPPYYGTFDDYTKKRFNYDDFCNFLIEANQKYCHLILSNSNEFKRKLEDMNLFENIKSIEIQDRINRKNPGNKRIEILAY